MSRTRLDLIGLRFGRLTVIGAASDNLEPSGRVKSMFQVQCDCGNTNIVNGSALRRGNTQSCGCLHRERLAIRATKHGGARKGRFDPEYTSYVGMLQRCRDPNHSRYKDYGGRGIRVCDRWINGNGRLSGYECFRNDMGRRPSRNHTLDRWPDNDGPYEPGNCRWATRSQQEQNKRRKLNVIMDGKFIPLTHACEIMGIKPGTARKRLSRGMTPEMALGIKP